MFLCGYSCIYSTFTQVSKSPSTQVPSTQALKYSRTQELKYSSTQVLKYSSTQALKHSSTQALKYSKTQALKYSSSQVLKHSSTQVHYRSAILTSITDHLAELLNVLLKALTHLFHSSDPSATTISLCTSRRPSHVDGKSISKKISGLKKLDIF